MSEFDFRDSYQEAAADERERAADWDANERAWVEARQDALTRDASERRTPCPYCGRTENHRQSCQLFAVVEAPVTSEAFPKGPTDSLTPALIAVVRAALPSRGTPHHEMAVYMQREQQKANAAHDALDALGGEMREVPTTYNTYE